MTLYSIGHSNAGLTAFLDLLRRYKIAVLVDARSQPYSRYNPHFSRESLKQSVNEYGIEYVYLGDGIGGKPEAREFYFPNGKVNFEALAHSPIYLSGIEQLSKLAEQRTVAFMCAEADYKHCHRYWLITRTLVERGIEVRHILHTGEAIGSAAAEFESLQLSLF